MIDLSSIASVEFGVALLKGDPTHYHVPVAPNVTEVLEAMLRATLQHLGDSDGWANFDCAEQHPQTTRLKYNVDDPALSKIKNLYTAQNIPSAADALSNPSNLDYYFARFRDASNNECMGVRKASYFKGQVGRSLMSWIDGQLSMINGDIFRLDDDFDFLVFVDQVAIYRPTFFERIASLEEEIAKATPSHIQAISNALPFLDIGFAANSTRSRRLVAAIKSRDDLSGITADHLNQVCEENQIILVKENGKLKPEPKYEIDFLEMLDRRRYNDPLINDDPTAYRAPARSKVKIN